ncbi:MAG: ornithine carbamoyltransferase [Eubacteriales bacterium]|nr:ornithine carbamoyltransferase [Eubacteriales bacterium]
MDINLKGRSFLTLKDYTPDEIRYLLDLARTLKENKRQGKMGNSLKGKNIVLIFEKTSTRTRCAFETACYDEGGHATFLSNSQMGKKESLEDTAKVLGRFYDGIEFRGFSQKTVEDLALHSGVPVWNGLTDLYHPTQALADLLTLMENTDKPLSECKFTYVGDGRNNVANSIMIICAKLGMHACIVSPKELWPDKDLQNYCEDLAKSTGAKITVSHELDAVLGSDVLYTDVWVSMGEEDKFKERIELLKDYQVNKALVEKAQNPNLIFLHCLPAFHDLNTAMGLEVYEKYGLKEMEVSDEVFRAPYSKVFDQAENRLHTIKAVMVATIGSREMV